MGQVVEQGLYCGILDSFRTESLRQVSDEVIPYVCWICARRSIGVLNFPDLPKFTTASLLHHMIEGWSSSSVLSGAFVSSSIFAPFPGVKVHNFCFVFLQCVMFFGFRCFSTQDAIETFV